MRTTQEKLGCLAIVLDIGQRGVATGSKNEEIVSRLILGKGWSRLGIRGFRDNAPNLVRRVDWLTRPSGDRRMDRRAGY